MEYIDVGQYIPYFLFFRSILSQIESTDFVQNIQKSG